MNIWKLIYGKKPNKQKKTQKTNQTKQTKNQLSNNYKVQVGNNEHPKL